MIYPGLCRAWAGPAWFNAWAGKHKPVGEEPIGAIGDEQSKQSNSNPIRT